MIDKGVCDKRFIWNPSNCECQCYKSRDFSEHLDYKNCKCKKRLVDKLVEEWTKNIEEIRLVEISSLKLVTVLSCCALFCFQYFLQLTLELVLILFIFIGA